MLTEREKIVTLVANGIAVYSILNERGEIPAGGGGDDSGKNGGDSVTIYSFVLDAVPPPYRSEITAEIIDEVFAAVTSAHNS